MNSSIEFIIPRIFRAVRKHQGLRQTGLAEMLGTSQATISKIESGDLDADLLVWVGLCRTFNLEPSSVLNGRIEMLGAPPIGFTNQLPGSFKMSPRYSSSMGTAMRAVYPLVALLYRHLGEKKADAFFEDIGVDVDYLTIMSNPVNILFANDVFQKLQEEGAINRGARGFLEQIPFQEAFSLIYSNVRAQSTTVSGLRYFVKTLNTLYDVNTTLSLSGDKAIKAHDNPYLSGLKLSKDYNHFRKALLAEQCGFVLNELGGGDESYKVQERNQSWELTLHAS